MSSSPSDSVSSISEAESSSESLPEDSDPDSSMSCKFFPLVAIILTLTFCS